MKKLMIIRRGVNSRRAFRKLNSVTELVGKEVEVTDDSVIAETEVEEVSVDKNQDVTLTMANGDEVVIDSEEAEELIETGEVVTEPEAKPETEDFEVTREVTDADGNVSEVTTKVNAESEGSAIKEIELLDSRRSKNARSYRARKINSEVETPVDPEPEVPAEPETKEIKVVRTADCDGKKVRKIASVTAPTVDEAIEAVKAKDTKDGIVADGYAELVEKEPTSTVTINSDIDEVIEMPEDPKEPEVPAEPETPADPVVEEPIVSELNAAVKQCPVTKKWFVDGDESKTMYDTEEDAVKAAEAKPAEEPEVDRESNSFKGVAEFIQRKYGVTL